MRQFTVHQYNRPEDCPESIPWEMIAPYEKQAINNHGQTLEGLNERGGLDACEIYAVMHGISFGQSKRLNETRCVEWLKSRIQEYGRE